MKGEKEKGGDLKNKLKKKKVRAELSTLNACMYKVG